MWHKGTVHTCNGLSKMCGSCWRQALLLLLMWGMEGVTLSRMACAMLSVLVHVSFRLHFRSFWTHITYATRCQVPTSVWAKRKRLQTCYFHTLQSRKTWGLAEEFMKVAGKLNVVMLMGFFPHILTHSTPRGVWQPAEQTVPKSSTFLHSTALMIEIACCGIIALRSDYLFLPIPYLYSQWKKQIWSGLKPPVFCSLLILFSLNIYECCSPTVAEPSWLQHHGIPLRQRITTVFCGWRVKADQGSPWPVQDYSDTLRQNLTPHLHVLTPVSLIDSAVLRCPSFSTHLGSARRASCGKQKLMNLSGYYLLEVRGEFFKCLKLAHWWKQARLFYD